MRQAPLSRTALCWTGGSQYISTGRVPPGAGFPDYIDPRTAAHPAPPATQHPGYPVVLSARGLICEPKSTHACKAAEPVLHEEQKLSTWTRPAAGASADQLCCAMLLEP